MKKTLAASLIAVPFLTLSSMAFAAEPESREPMLLTAVQMDEVTAGRPFYNPGFWRSFSYKRTDVAQINVSPVTIIQIGNNNTAIVYSGNFSSIYH